MLTGQAEPTRAISWGIRGKNSQPRLPKKEEEGRERITLVAETTVPGGGGGALANLVASTHRQADPTMPSCLCVEFAITSDTSQAQASAAAEWRPKSTLRNLHTTKSQFRSPAGALMPLRGLLFLGLDKWFRG
jgi:hypothetical protein